MANEASRALYQTMRSYLVGLGLGELAQVNSQGAPAGWLWQKILEGADTPDELLLAIEQTDVWRNEYGVIVEQRRRQAAGEPVRPMSVEEVVAYRANAASMFRQAGLPTWLRDGKFDFDALMLAGVSLQEVAERVGEAFSRVRDVDPTIRQAFSDFYGVGQGDAALAAWFLDPERTQASIDRASRSAYTAGLAARYGFEVDRATAERIASKPMTEQGIDEAFRQVNQLGGVFDAGYSERDTLELGEEGMASIFEGDPLATRSISRRVAGRRTNDQSSFGGAALTREGLVGTRAAE